MEERKLLPIGGRWVPLPAVQSLILGELVEAGPHYLSLSCTRARTRPPSSAPPLFLPSSLPLSLPLFPTHSPRRTSRPRASVALRLMAASRMPSSQARGREAAINPKP
jgi:hypothetical protein